jgi:hypothetical protein
MLLPDSAQMKLARMALANLQKAQEQVNQRAIYEMLELYYQNNGLYDVIAMSGYETGIWTEAMKPLGNPANRCVEYYVSTVWPGPIEQALPIVTDNERIIEPIMQIWKWSNWGVNKQLSMRWFANLGDMFIKVPTRSNSEGRVDQVFLQLVKPNYVTDLDEDERGYLTYIRMDIPFIKREGDKTKPLTRTEVWDKLQNSFRVWEHDKGPDEELNRLGDPIENRGITEFGFDFIPVVHGKFRDTGEDRGVCAYMHTLDKIDELNRMITRLHQIMFRWNKTHLVVKANAMDPSGRPMAPPKIERSDDRENDEVTDSDIYFMPGVSDIGALVPNIDYAAYVTEIKRQIDEIEQDLPELAYYRMRELGSQISGKAVRLLLTSAIDRALEARGNAEEALARANQMALTIGGIAGLFKDIGTYESGDFEHAFAEREVIPVPESEQAEIVRTETGAGVPLVVSLRRHGWSEDQIKEVEEIKAKEEAESLANALRKFDAGGGAGASRNGSFAT